MDFTRLNETDVREEIIAPLIRELGYQSASEHNVLREQSLRYPRNYLGRKNPKKDPVLRGKADYILEAGGAVRWIIEAKAPSSNINSDEIEQACTYANHPEVCAVYFVLCNGKTLQIYQTNRGAEAPPVLSIDYEKLSDSTTKTILFNLLSPQAVLRDHPRQLIDLRPPIGPGLRSIVRVTGGYISYHKSTLPIPALNELQVSIMSGAIERDSENRMIAFLESRGPTRSIQEFVERLGLSKFEMLSIDGSISTDTKKPTKFTYTKSVTFPAGEELLDVNTWKMVVLPIDMHVNVTATASGIIEANKFYGSFINDMIINETIPINLEGQFCLYIN
jgi:hypothetical protein